MADVILAIGAVAHWGGETSGKVTSLVVGRGQDGWQVTHLVIQPLQGAEPARIVPRDQVHDVDADTSELRLRYTDEGFASLSVAEDILPEVLPGEEELRRGDRAHATDGDIGHLNSLCTDHDTGNVTCVRLNKHLWGKEELAIPIIQVSGFEAGIHLNITKHEAMRLLA
jgi:hypothetical protein